MSIEIQNNPKPKTFLDIGIGVEPQYRRFFSPDEVRPGDVYIGFDLPKAMTVEGIVSNAKGNIEGAASEGAATDEKQRAAAEARILLGQRALRDFISKTDIKFQMIYGDGRRLPFQDASVDEVGMHNVIGDPSIEDDTKLNIVSEALRVAKHPVRILETKTSHVALNFLERMFGLKADIEVELFDAGIVSIKLTPFDENFKI